MDKQKSLLNISVSVGFKLVTMIMSIVVKRMLIRTCGNDVNGLNALYVSIIGFLTVTELGVGTAITFCMYKPIVQDETEKVAALYHLFQRIYTIVGAAILVFGLLLMPFLRYFAKDYAQIEVDLYTSFVLVLLSTVLTYFFGAKVALINAHKNNYITTMIGSGGIVLQYVLQILVLQLTGSFYYYLFCKIAAALAQWLATEIVSRKKYANLLRMKEKVDAVTRKELTKHIKAMFTHKVGALLVNTFDSMIISAFVGVVALGEYSNYTAILNSMVGVIGLIFSSLTSVWGHVYAKEGKVVTRKYCDLFQYVNFAVGMVFFLGYFAIIDDLIAVIFSEDLVVSGQLSAVIAINGFVQFMRQNALAFKDITGTFYYDRWKPVVEGVTNIVLSILFVKWMGVFGVIAATIVTNLVICHVVEPYVLYKNAFGVSAKQYYLKNYGMVLLFIATLVAFSKIKMEDGHRMILLLSNGSLSVAISGTVCVLLLMIQPGIRRDLFELFGKG